MRNALFSSMSSQPYNLGNNEVQMPHWDVSMLQVDSIITNIHRNGFSVDSRLYKDDNQLRDGGFSVSCQSSIGYQQGFQSISTSFDNISQQSPLLSRKRTLPPFEASQQNRLLPQQGINDLVCNNNTALTLCRKTNKKKKVNKSCEEKWHHHPDNNASTEQRLQVPVRRSQKLSDKITTLQKLVSPYGKTDTASVLQEASLYIKLLQEQIQNMFQMLSSSYSNVKVLHSKEMTLRSRGLCLVPISFTHKVTEDDLVDPQILSRN
ncbi:transcription factor bHLH111-like [Mangifera indica]|uniref:transcription factor bHLH111-like n=1 Tax=Mangifera indica TaxID=29780 RepID=UPI001CFB3E02|nr:transcription factor bHLH111-like [Mangifera indica]XP_044509428.1 transcription factor bHLH111-like [Mangifera indica]